MVNVHAQVSGDFDVDELLAADYVRDPLRRHDLPPTTDGCAAVVLARGKKAYELCERPAWITGIDHRIEPHLPTLRDLTRSVSTEQAAEGAGVGRRPGRGGRAVRAVQLPGADPAPRPSASARAPRSTPRVAPWPPTR